MLSPEEINLLIRMIERTYQCRICINDGYGNYLFSINFPEIDTTHLAELCRWGVKLESSRCHDCDDLTCGIHGSKNLTSFYKICPYDCMEIVGTVLLPGLKSFQIYGGIFKSRTDLPNSALVFSRKLTSQFSDTLRELSDAEFTELPIVWDMLIREITILFEQQILDNEAKEPKEIILDYINGNFRKNISLSGLATKLGWSDSHATVKIRQMFGKNFVRLLNERRIENAKWLLRNKFQKQISEIAKVSGYRSTPYFYRVFSLYEGMTPLEYRNSTSELDYE